VSVFITPSGLSVLIRELENQLGFRLFDRTTRHVGLTGYGNDLLAATRRNLQELDAAMSRIGRSAKGGSQLISLGTTPLVAVNILPQAIREFRSQRPDLRIQLFDADQTTIWRMVEAGKLDLGLGIPSFGLPVCRNRKVVMSRLVNPVVHLEFDQISNRGKKLSPGADEFTAFLKTHIARWAGRTGVL
jgi:DNA-binding transcriptional LysR family regulator